MSKEAMKLALEVLEKDVRFYKAEKLAAITAIREALAEQPAQQEPVAWADECRIELVIAIHFLASDFENALGVFGGDIEARRKAEGDIAHARSVASRWNWNGTSLPAQQEPVAWICEGSSSDEKHAIDYWPGDVDDLPIGTQLYASPPAQRTWVGLTDEEMDDCWNKLFGTGNYNRRNVYRAIEAKLREKNNGN